MEIYVEITDGRLILAEIRFAKTHKDQPYLESVYKPGSVLSNHSSRARVTTEPQATYPNPTRAAPKDSYLVLLRAGFTMPQAVASCAVRSYRTISPLPVSKLLTIGGIFSAALSVDSRLPGVTWHSALWSPDFPPLIT